MEDYHSFDDTMIAVLLRVQFEAGCIFATRTCGDGIIILWDEDTTPFQYQIIREIIAYETANGDAPPQTPSNPL